MIRSSYTLPALLKKRMDRIVAKLAKRGIPKPNWSRVICVALEKETSRLEREYKK